MIDLRYKVIPPLGVSMPNCIVIREPPYAERHVRWCERSGNESRKKTTSFSSYSITFAMRLWAGADYGKKYNIKNKCNNALIISLLGYRL